MRTIFAGTPEFAVPALRALASSSHKIGAVITQPDRPAGRGRKLRASAVKNLANELGLPVHQPQTLRSPGIQDILSGLGADVMVVIAYGLILPKAVLEIPRLGCINIHASLLPRWRGAAPIQRAILAGDSHTGVTVMLMGEGLDTGAILLQRRVPIADTDTAANLHDRLAATGGEALLQALAGLESGSLEARVQDEAGATYAAKLSKAEAELNWRADADSLARAVRAFNPWPVAQTSYRGERLRVWKATPLTATAGSDRPPGCVIATCPQGIDVATGDGTLRLLQLQVPGKRRVSAGEFLNAHELDGVCLPC